MKELLLKALNFLGLAFWVEIVTDRPRCTYYFGPFLSYKEAKMAQGGYIEDLQQENAQGIATLIKRVKPSNLTVFDEKEDSKLLRKISTFSSQAF
jgi:hypothetical protein